MAKGKWSCVAPSAAGHYWIRRAGEGHAVIARIDGAGLICVGMAGDGVLKFPPSLLGYAAPEWWSEPIKPPPMTGASR